MKLTAFLLCVFFVQVSAGVFSQNNGSLTLKAEKESVNNILMLIEEKSDFRFLFNSNNIDVERKIDINVNSKSVEEVLNQLFEGTNVKFRLFNFNYVLYTEDENFPSNIQQQKVISGTVSDTGGLPLPGVAVFVKGTSYGTVTDTNGSYTIGNISKGGILVFSFIGMQTQEIEVTNQTTIDIVMKVDFLGIEEVVVTSFGIKKTQKELTYSSQAINGEQLATVGNTNLLNSLQGKIAGVSVKLTSGLPGRSPEIKIRGSRSLTGNNNPLYVVDGMPIAGNIDDINSDDIKSLNVLKGPAASALYGLRASNGVILITTKSGEGAKGEPSILLSTYYGIDQVAYLPDLQTEYGQGSGGKFQLGSPFAWGPKISEIGTYKNEFGEDEVAQSYDNDKAFYKNGSTFNTNFSISNAGDIGSYMIGIGHNNQKGIIPGTDLKRTNIVLNGKYLLSKKLEASISFNYSDLDYNDYPDLEGNDNYFRSLTDVPPSYNLAGKPFEDKNDPYKQMYFRSSQNNPYWVVEHNSRSNARQRTFGNIFLTYKLSNDLSLNYRIGLDHFNENRLDYRDLGTGASGRTNPPSQGRIGISNQLSDQFNSNFYASYKKKINDDLLIDAVVGNELFDSRYNITNSIGTSFVSGSWANLANATSISASNYDSKQRLVGFYGNLNFGWKEMLYINASGRNDFVSNMPPGNRSFFYPSIGTSLIVTEAIPSLKSVLYFGKIRASVAEVGQTGPVFVNNVGYVSNNPNSGFGSFTFPFNGLAGWSQSSTRVNPNLKPENTKTIEMGFDFRFLENRIGIDYTYFNSKSENQIFNVAVPFSTGASSEIRNGGEISSKGHEIILSLVPVKTSNFTWNLTTNFNTIDNKVESLTEGVDRIVINNMIVAQAGYSFPSILGQAYYKDPATNQTVVDSNPSSAGYGYPLLNNDQIIIGSPVPDFEMSIMNTLTYKNLSINFQVDWHQGGQLFSQSYVETRWRGLNGITHDRDVPVILEGKKGHLENGNLIIDGDNDISIKKDYNYYTAIGRWLPTEESLQDASFVRLREVAVNYVFPKSWLARTFIKSAEAYMTGRNLLLITKSFTDPEVNHSDGRSSNTEGLEWSNIPQTKSVGLGLKLKF